MSFSALQADADTDANSVDPNETAHVDPSHQDLHYLLFFSGYRIKPEFAAMDMSKFKDGRFHFRNLGVKRVNSTYNVLFSFISGVSKMGHRTSKIANGYYEDVWVKIDKDKRDVELSDITGDGQTVVTGCRVDLDWDQIYSKNYSLLDPYAVKTFDFKVSRKKKMAFMSVVTTSGLVICNKYPAKKIRGIFVNKDGFVQDLDDDLEEFLQEKRKIALYKQKHKGATRAKQGKKRKGRRRRRKSSDGDEEKEERDEEGPNGESTPGEGSDNNVDSTDGSNADTYFEREFNNDESKGSSDEDDSNDSTFPWATPVEVVIWLL